MNDCDGWAIVCPTCRTSLDSAAADRVACACCEEVFERNGDVWCFLPEQRKRYFADFLRDYTHIRLAEGRGSNDPDDYLDLPDCSPDHPVAWQWSLRRRTYHCFRRRVLGRLGAGLRVLDLGAGVGWLSHRLSEAGDRPCAVELSEDDRDGLGAARHYPGRWPRIRAEFDRLPFPDDAADMVIYNASLHYSTDYYATLQEACRVLRPGGRIVVLETPIYRREESGKQMMAERHAEFERQYGLRSERLPSQGFLTWRLLDGLTQDLNLKCERIKPWYGWRWALRPWAARLRSRREPSTFAILVLQKRA